MEAVHLGNRKFCKWSQWSLWRASSTLCIPLGGCGNAPRIPPSPMKREEQRKYTTSLIRFVIWEIHTVFCVIAIQICMSFSKSLFRHMLNIWKQKSTQNDPKYSHNCTQIHPKSSQNMILALQGFHRGSFWFCFYFLGPFFGRNCSQGVQSGSKVIPNVLQIESIIRKKRDQNKDENFKDIWTENLRLLDGFC